MGGWLTTAESVMLGLVGDSRVAQFKSVQKLIHDKSLPAGLQMFCSEDDVINTTTDGSGKPLVKSSL